MDLQTKEKTKLTNTILIWNYKETWVFWENCNVEIIITVEQFEQL